MAENSSIEWTEHTFNPWWGCTKMSGACRRCYAGSKHSRRLGFDLWGPNSDRRLFGEDHWREPLKWDARAGRRGERARVFCASMGDVFEARDRPGCLAREALGDMIEATPNLDWLLLTKRPEMVAGMVPWTIEWPMNVWVGTTVEDQATADLRLPFLASLPAAGRFVSAEPLQGPLEIFSWLDTGRQLGHRRR